MASLLLTGASHVLGSQVVLQEIPLSLYNKPVTGFRFTVDRSQRSVEQQILKHVAESDPLKPFQHDKTIIFENIRYRPITDEQPISLHYLLRGYENHYTQVTLVAMYDLRRSISTRDFPDMALRLQIDLARMLRKMSGDVLKFGNILFDDAKIKELQAKMSQPQADPTDPVKANRTNVVVPDAGFEDGAGGNGDPDSVIAALRKRISELETREQEWMRQEANLRTQQREVDQKQTELQTKLEENRYLKDSVEALNKRMKSLLGQYYVSDDISVTNETAEYIASLELQIKRQEKMLIGLEQTNDSLVRRVNEYGMMMRENAKARQTMADDIIRLKAENDALQKQVAKLQDDLAVLRVANAGESSNDSLIHQLRDAQGQNVRQQEEMTALKAEGRLLRKENEDLESSVQRLHLRIADLEAENKSLAKGTEPKPNPQLDELRDSLATTRQRLATVQTRLNDIEQQQGSVAKAAAENRVLQDSLVATRQRETALQSKLRENESKGNTNSKVLAENKVLQDSLSATRQREIALQSKLRENESKGNTNSKVLAENRTLQDSLTATKQREMALQSKLRDSQSSSASNAKVLAANKSLQDSLTTMRMRLGSMQTRLEEAENKAAMATRVSTPVGPSPEAKALQDSLSLMKSRMSFLQNKLAEADKRDKQSADREATLKLKETENRNLQSKLTEAQTQLNTSQTERKRLEQNLATTQATLKSAQEATTAAKAEQDKLAKEKASLQSRLNAAEGNIGMDAAAKKTLTDSVAALNRKVKELDGQIIGRDKTIRSEIHRRDSIQKQLLIQQNRENDLKRQMVVQQAKVDSLTRLSMPVQDQQKFIRDQWAKLTEWQKQLEARETSTANQEKLTAQRLASLDTREKEVAKRESAVVGLEERERQVSLREQQVNTRENISGTMVNPADVKIVRLTDFGPNVPVFTVETDLNFRAAQKQVVAYMLSRDILLNEQLPDLLFKNAYLSELSEGQIEVRVRVDSKSGGSAVQFTFKLANGTYLGELQSGRLNDVAKQLIVRILRYRT